MQKNQNTRFKKKVFLIDIDNTICNTVGSTYAKSKPKKKNDKINQFIKN